MIKYFKNKKKRKKEMQIVNFDKDLKFKKEIPDHKSCHTFYKHQNSFLKQREKLKPQKNIDLLTRTSYPQKKIIKMGFDYYWDISDGSTKKTSPLNSPLIKHLILLPENEINKRDIIVRSKNCGINNYYKKNKEEETKTLTKNNTWNKATMSNATQTIQNLELKTAFRFSNKIVLKEIKMNKLLENDISLKNICLYNNKAETANNGKDFNLKDIYKRNKIFEKYKPLLVERFSKNKNNNHNYNKNILNTDSCERIKKKYSRFNSIQLRNYFYIKKINNQKKEILNTIEELKNTRNLMQKIYDETFKDFIDKSKKKFKE